MRSCGWLLLAACSQDPSLAIAVHHPKGHAVEQTSVTVYFGDVDCDQIEFGDRTAAELDALATGTVEVTTGARVEISRLGGKSIVARGYDAQRRFVTAGCKDVGEIAGQAEVAIDTQPTASVAIDPGQPDRPFGERTILVNMTDVDGNVLDGTVSWRLTGPAGALEQMATAGTPTKNGNLKIQVADLGQPGPEALRIRAPWATAPLPLVTAFDLSHATSLPLGGGSVASHPSCDVRGHAGKPPTLVCLTQANLGGHRDAVEIAWQGDHYAASALAIPSSIDNQFALFVDHDGGVDEPVYVLAATAAGTGSWYRLGDSSAPTVVFDSALQNVVYIPRCGDGATTALVAVETGTALGVGNKVRFFTPAGAAIGAAAVDGEVFSGGCLHDVDHREHQGVVLAGANGDAALELIAPGAGTATPVAALRLTGSGFVTVETQGAIEKRFAGARLQAAGTVVYEAVLAPQGGSYALVERSELDAAAPPEKILGAKLDRDGDSDLMWDMGVGSRRRLFQVSLAEQVGGVPLTAVTSGPPGASTTTANPVDFVAADLNGKNAEEMVVFTQSTVTIYSPDE